MPCLQELRRCRVFEDKGKEQDLPKVKTRAIATCNGGKIKVKKRKSGPMIHMWSTLKYRKYMKYLYTYMFNTPKELTTASTGMEIQDLHDPSILTV